MEITYGKKIMVYNPDEVRGKGICFKRVNSRCPEFFVYLEGGMKSGTAMQNNDV